MSFYDMYDGQVNSPPTQLASSINSTQTNIDVNDASVLPAGPNMAILGQGTDAETILYASKSGNTLQNCTREFQGTKKAWDAGTQVVRGVTDYDFDALRLNLSKLINGNIKNLIIDGGFLYWFQTSSTANPATDAYVHTLSKVKHYKASGTRPTITISRQDPTPGELNNSSKLFRIAASGADVSMDSTSYHIPLRRFIYQGVRHYTNGQKITIGFRAKASVAGQKLGICIRQNYGTSGSPTSEENIAGTIFTLTTSFADYYFTFTTNSLTGKYFGTDENDALIADIFCQAGADVVSSLLGGGSAFGFTQAVNIDLTELRAFPGEEFYPFRPDPIEDRNKTIAFYQKSYEDKTNPGAVTTTGALVWYNEVLIAYNGTLVYFTPKVKVPAITLYSPNSGASGNIYNATDSADVAAYASYASAQSFKLTFNASVGASKSCQAHWVADARF